jgi:hypothetical protein
MAATPEAKVKKAIRAVLDTYGAYYVMPVTGGFGNSGAPDFLVCYRGWFIGLEAKAGKGKPTALQQRNLDKIAECNGVSLVIWEDTVHAVETLLRSIDNIGAIQNGNFK